MQVLPFSLPSRMLIHNFDIVFYSCQTMKKFFPQPTFYLITTDDYFQDISKGIFDLLGYFSTVSSISQYYFDITTKFPQTSCQ